jgi:uncharacterized protein YkwD
MTKTAQKIFLSLSVAAALFSVATAPAASAAPARRGLQLTSLESGILASLNATRAHSGLAQLRISRGLTAAARQHSREMGRLGYFAHESAGGGSFDARVGRYYPFASGFHRWSVGENLAWESPDLDANEALRLWMASPEHRKNILTPSWREIGISAVHVAGAGGVFGGGDVTIVTTDFGVRS